MGFLDDLFSESKYLNKEKQPKEAVKTAASAAVQPLQRAGFPRAVRL